VTPGVAGNGAMRTGAFRAECRRPTVLLYRFFTSVDPSLLDFCPTSSVKEERRKHLESYSSLLKRMSLICTARVES
jgi:hypothetical protein